MQLSIYCSIATAIVDNLRYLVGTSVVTPTENRLCEVYTFPDAYASGGNKWTRTTDLTLIRRVL